MTLTLRGVAHVSRFEAWQVLPRVAICDLEALAPHTEIALTGQKENEDKFGQKRVGHGELSWLLDSASVV